MPARLPLNLTASDFPHPSRRMPVVAPHGVVATSSQLAAQAGVRMLLQGGSAVDAAIATAAVLILVEPWSNGIGSDAFAIVWDGAALHGLNGSGRAPAAHSLELFSKLGASKIPGDGWLSVTVPGAPAAWVDLHARFGKLPFAALFEPAINYAENGFPLGPEGAAVWARAQRRYAADCTAPEYAGWHQAFFPGGREAKAGDVWRLPDHGRSLRLIAESKAEAFYRGELGAAMAKFAAETGGYITQQDLAEHTSTWDAPISVDYRGVDVWELPAAGQGVAALQALAMLQGFDLPAMARDSAESYHLQLEATKLACVDTYAYVADPTCMPMPVEALLDPAYVASRRSLIGAQAIDPSPGQPPRGGTVYLCAADANGMMVSFIQSNSEGFGSGIVVPGTGISLQNRGRRGFSLDPQHPSVLAPRKRPFHTIIPGFLTQDGRALGPFGVMGGYMQPQGHVQMVVNQVDYGMNPQASLDAPRWFWAGAKQVQVEGHTDPTVIEGLTARGHEVRVDATLFRNPYGRGQIIRRLDNGSYVAGAEPRSDGAAVGY